MNLFKKIFAEKHPKIKLRNTPFEIIVSKDMAWCYQEGQYYEKKVSLILSEILNHYKIKPVLYDIGANSGYYSITLSPYTSKIYSFEPFAESFEFLSKNIKLNRLKDIDPFKIALSDYIGKTELKVYNSSGNNSLYERTVPDSHPLKMISSQKIDLYTLDYFIKFKNLEKPDVIKIDVEGAELPILRGAIYTLRMHSPTIVLEYSDSTANDAGYKKEEIYSFLSDLDYNFYAIPSEDFIENLITFDKFDEYKSENIIATKLNLNHLL